ncbi:18463_t:CDS:2, partial [Dentiscutata erythropus]
KTQKQDDTWDNVCEKVESWSTKSTNNEEKSYEIPTLSVNFESQFSVLKLKFFTRYEEYIDDRNDEEYPYLNIRTERSVVSFAEMNMM